jgi:signal peptidase II
MDNNKMKIYKYFILAFAVILIDQTSKLLVHQYMFLHQEITVLGSEQYGFKLHYLLNPGMAFGIRWNNEFGKLALTAFRIAAMFGIGYYLIKMAQKGSNSGFLWCMAMILGGAVGNVIDSTFYGVLLNNHPGNSPTPWFHGQVIDMLFFPLFDYTWPDWFPYFGGEYFLFFSPVFNIADSSIFLGVMIILVFQRHFFGEKSHSESDTEDETAVDDALSSAEADNKTVIENPDHTKPI